MTCQSSDDVTLATFPTDIVRHIIDLNVGESVHNMCLVNFLPSFSSSRLEIQIFCYYKWIFLISPIWNVITVEFREHLPPVAYIGILRFDDSEGLLFGIRVKKKHLKHFLYFLPRSFYLQKDMGSSQLFFQNSL